MILGIIFISISLIWAIIGSIQLIKIYKKQGGIPVDTAIGAFIFIILPVIVCMCSGLLGVLLELY